MTLKLNPLTCEPPAEVPLPRAPLIRVIAQVRFPLIVAVELREFVAPFQEAIRKQYPVLRQEQTQTMVMTPNGITPSAPHVAWKFSDLQGHWRVSLASDFLAIETSLYTNRADFFSRFKQLLVALNEHVQPSVIDRLGVRYVNRVVGAELKEIASLVQPQVLGIIGTDAVEQVQSSLTESRFTVAPGQVLARWGYLPKGATFDPSVIEQAEEPCWILDVDMFTAQQQAFDPDRVLQDAKQFAERIYAIFRWAVTPQFLQAYGGNV